MPSHLLSSQKLFVMLDRADHISPRNVFERNNVLYSLE